MENYTLLLLLVGLSSVCCLTKQQYPSIISDPVACWGGHSGTPPDNLRICDPDQIVSDNEAIDLNKMAESVRKSTSCPCHRRKCHVARLTGRPAGYIITTVLVRTMNLTASEDKLTAAEDYAKYLRTSGKYYKWGFATCEEDIIVFLAFDEKVVYVVTGSTAMAAVSNDELSDIIRGSRDSFKSSTYQGLKNIINNISSELRNGN